MGAIFGKKTTSAEQHAADDTTHGTGWGVPRPARQKEVTKGELASVKEAVLVAMKREGYDDGSLGPLFVRLAWHSCGTYDASTKTGGSAAGATMRFPPERDDPDSAGLQVARDALEPLHAKFPWLSYADLYILAGSTALATMGGPDVEVKLGRKDHPGPTSPILNGRLPNPDEGLEEGVEEGTNRLKGWEKLAEQIRKKFYRMGFADPEIVALVCGGHVFGRGHRDRSGYQGAWVENPLEFSSEFASDLIGDEWALVDGSSKKDQAEIPLAVCPVAGKKQYVSHPHGDHPQMMLPSDMVFRWDEKFAEYTKKYAEDVELLKTDFGTAWKKLIELGCDGILYEVK